MFLRMGFGCRLFKTELSRTEFLDNACLFELPMRLLHNSKRWHLL